MASLSKYPSDAKISKRGSIGESQRNVNKSNISESQIITDPVVEDVEGENVGGFQENLKEEVNEEQQENREENQEENQEKQGEQELQQEEQQERENKTLSIIKYSRQRWRGLHFFSIFWSFLKKNQKNKTKIQ